MPTYPSTIHGLGLILYPRQTENFRVWKLEILLISRRKTFRSNWSFFRSPITLMVKMETYVDIDVVISCCRNRRFKSLKDSDLLVKESSYPILSKGIHRQISKLFINRSRMYRVTIWCSIKNRCSKNVKRFENPVFKL